MIIIVVIKILFEILYEVVGEAFPQIMFSVNWSIAYNFIDYMCFSSVAMYMYFLISSDKKFPKWVSNYKLFLQGLFFMASMSYWMLAWVELWFINAPLEVYQDGLMGGGLWWANSASMIIGVVTFFGTFNFKRLYIKYRYL